MSTVLAAIDNSLAARPVLRATGLFAELLHATPVALHVRMGTARTAQALADAAHVPLRVAQGDPEKVLTAAMLDPRVLLGVFGARSRPGGRRPVGHVTLAAASTTSKPVLVVPPQARIGDDGRRIRIIVPLDGSEETDRGAAHAQQLFAATAVEVTLLHAFTGDTLPRFWDEPQHEGTAWVREFIARHWPVADTAVEMALGPAGAAVLAAADATVSDVIALVWGQQVRDDRAKVVRDVLAAARVPVLLLPLTGSAQAPRRAP